MKLEWETEHIGEAKLRLFDADQGSVWEGWILSIGYSTNRGWYMWMKPFTGALASVHVDMPNVKNEEEAKAAALAIWRMR